MTVGRAAVLSRHRRRRAMVVAVLTIALIALFAPAGVPAGHRVQAQDSTTCAQWDVSGVTWGPFQQGGFYTPTLTFAASQDPTQVSGEMTLPEGQWENAAWAGPSQPFTGTVLVDKLSILVTPARTDTLISRGRYQGTITPSGSITLGQPTDVQVNDGTWKDEAHPERNGTWTVSGQATCSPCPSTSASPAAAPAGSSQALLADTPVPATCRYVALGDSFSSGEGVPPFFDSGNQCHRSKAAYPVLIAGRPHIPKAVEFYACSGSTTDDFYNPNHANPNELPQLDHLAPSGSPPASLVTFSVGGNDVGFADILSKCVKVEPLQRVANPNWIRGCSSVVEAETAPKLEKLATSLPALYQKIKEKVPNAQVYVIGPPSIFPDSPSDDSVPGLFDIYACQRQAHFEDATDALEGVPFASVPITWGIKSEDLQFLAGIFRKVNSAAAKAAAQAGVHFIDLTDAFKDRDVCKGGDAYANSLILQGGAKGGPLPDPTVIWASVSSYSFHPNAAGQKVMADLIAKAIGDEIAKTPLNCQPQQTTQAPIDVAPGQDTLGVQDAWPGSSIVMSLTSPSGITYDRGTQGAGVVHSLGRTSESYAIANPEPGRWTVNLFGADVPTGGERVSLDSAQIPASALAPLATIHASTDRGVAPKAIQFDVSHATAFGGASIAAYAWDFGDGSAPASGSTASHTFAAGRYTTTLTVTDSAQRSYVSRQRISVSATEQAPTASLVWVAANESGTVRFDGSQSGDVDGNVVQYAWDFGDGSHSSEVNPTHTYAQPGTYTASLTVTDDAGLKQSKQQTVAVRLGASAGAGGGTSGVGASVIVIIAAAVLALLIAVFFMLRRRVPVGVVAVPAAAGELLLSPEWRAAVAAVDAAAVAAQGEPPPRPRDPTASGGKPTPGDGAAKSAPAAADVYKALIVAQAPSTTRRVQNSRRHGEPED